MVFISGIENQLIKNHSCTFHQENKTSALNDENLEWRQEVKYLGLTLDSKLIWNRHVDCQQGKVINDGVRERLGVVNHQ